MWGCMKWVGVKDRLPDKDVDVLAYNGVNMFVAHYDGLWNTGEGWDMDINVTVTHWQSLPEPPGYAAEPPIIHHGSESI